MSELIIEEYKTCLSVQDCETLNEFLTCLIKNERFGGEYKRALCIIGDNCMGEKSLLYKIRKLIDPVHYTNLDLFIKFGSDSMSQLISFPQYQKSDDGHIKLSLGKDNMFSSGYYNTSIYPININVIVEISSVDQFNQLDETIKRRVSPIFVLMRESSFLSSVPAIAIAFSTTTDEFNNNNRELIELIKEQKIKDEQLTAKYEKLQREFEAAKVIYDQVNKENKAEYKAEYKQELREKTERIERDAKEMGKLEGKFELKLEQLNVTIEQQNLAIEQLNVTIEQQKIHIETKEQEYNSTISTLNSSLTEQQLFVTQEKEK